MPLNLTHSLACLPPVPPCSVGLALAIMALVIYLPGLNYVTEADPHQVGAASAGMLRRIAEGIPSSSHFLNDS